MIYNTRNDAIRWKTPDILYDGNSNVLLNLSPFARCSQNTKIRNVDLENEDQGQGQGVEE